MKAISILNDVIGPVMRGPSSSHTAGSYHLAALVRALLDDVPAVAEIAFDPAGSYARCYRSQASDLAFAAGLMGWPITDDRFSQALALAPKEGLEIGFRIEALDEARHPNTVRMRLRSRGGRSLEAVGRSIGGGAVELTTIDGWPVRLTGQRHELLVDVEKAAAASIIAELGDDEPIEEVVSPSAADRLLLVVLRRQALDAERKRRLAALAGTRRVYPGVPLGFVAQGEPLFDTAAAMTRYAATRGLSPGRVAARYEAELLQLPEDEIIEQMARRVDLMVAAVRRGLGEAPPDMQLLHPTAAAVYRADAEGRLAVGGLHARAAARAMAAMHVNCGRGVVCAAPTAGSAGVLPGVLATMSEERNVARRELALALLAAGAVGVVVAGRATFAAEVAGCQVEIGAAGAMAAAAVVDMAGGTMQQACDAAAISFQNTMGMVCDLVQGIVEIPCHTRNAAAASTAFVNADLILGGYFNPVPLDETLDAVAAVGRAMPAELRVTSLGGLAVTPSALALPLIHHDIK